MSVKNKAWALVDRDKGTIRMTHAGCLAIFNTRAEARLAQRANKNAMIRAAYLYGRDMCGGNGLDQNDQNP